jgi:fumarate reductase flavoprotein subunit
MFTNNDADVIIIGSGGAGLMAAIFASDEGAKVLVIDKGSRLGGTFLISEGTSVGCQTKMQFEAGILDDTPDLFYADCMKEERARKVCDPEILKFYCHEAGTMIDWMYDRGAYVNAFKCEKPMYGETWSRGRMYRVNSAKPYLAVLLKEFEQRVARGDAKYLLDTRVKGLVMNKARVTGVKCQDKRGVEKEIRGGAVIVATGGFCGNLDLMRKFKHPGAKAIVNVGWPDATGDALAWFGQVNAKMVNMDQELLPYMGTVPDPGDLSRPLAHLNMNKIGGGIWVDVNGRRIADEDCSLYWPAPRLAMAKAPENVVFAIFDHKTRTGAESIFVDWFESCHKQTWEWFDQQVNANQVIFKGNTIKELASRSGIDAVGLEHTFQRWNSFVASGKDEEFGRKSVSPRLDSPPYYAVMTVPSNLLSAGGPVTTVRTECVDATGKLIPGLFAVGEVTGYRPFGTGGMNTCCFVFGKQAGIHASRFAQGSRPS